LLLLLFCCIDVLVIAAAVVAAAAVIVAVVFLDCSPSLRFSFSSLFPCHHLYLHSAIHSFISHP
jgi:hypothetical protein